MKSQALVHQPPVVRFEGREFRLVTPYRLLPSQVGETRSEGPFYDSVPPDPTYVFLPDARFVLGQLDSPFYMHRLPR